ncbi:MAG: protein kinase [Actinomycetia bacterium]|nr:protein kinase [Actinomycetes bacterium]
MVGEIELGIDGLSDYQEIGRGGFATVYSAVQIAFNRKVAVKVLDALDDAGLRRFNREQLSMGTVHQHPNIVTPFTAGYTQPEGKPYLIMEYLSGGSLQQRLEETGPIGPHEAIELILPVAEALRHSHDSGIIHKDVKPGNILISDTGVVKLTDFGIAALQEATATAAVAFSLAYSPPETFGTADDAGPDDPRDERSDLYSLAATLYMLIVGGDPFGHPTNNSPAGYMARIVTQPVPLIDHPELDTFLAIAMAKDPGDRYPTATDFIDAIQPIAQTQPPVTGSAATMVAPLTPISRTTTPASIDPLPGEGETPPGPIDRDHIDLYPAESPETSSIDDRNTKLDPGPPSDDPIDSTGGSQGTLSTPRNRRWLLLAVLAAAAIVPAVAIMVISQRGGDGEPQGRDSNLAASDASTSSTLGNNTVTSSAPEIDAPGTTSEPTGPSGPIEAVVYRSHSNPVLDLAELSDGRIASASEDFTVRIWDVSDGNTLATYTDHIAVLGAVVELSDGRIASGGSDATVQIWDPANPGTTLATYNGHTDWVRDLVELSDGRIASASDDATVQIWDPANPGTTLATYNGHTGWVLDLVELSDGRIASASADFTVQIWDPANPGTTIATYSDHIAVLGAVVELSDGRIASGGSDGRVQIWDPANPGTTLATYNGHTDWVQDLIELSDGRIASASDDATVQIWDPANPGTTLATYNGHTDWVLDLVELSDGRIASASADATVQIWTTTQSDP